MLGSDQLTVVVEEELITPQQLDVVGAWAFDESSGSAVLDSSGMNNDGQLQGNPTRVTGPSGNALQLDGRGDYVVIPHDASLDLSDSITIAAWIRPDVEDSQYVVTKAQKRDADGFELSLSSKGSVFVRFNRETAGDSFRLDSTSDYPTDGNTWVHVAATYDGSTIRIYVNGQLENSRNAQFQIATNNLPIGIGAQHDGSRSMEGSVDDVQIHARALDANEIAQLMAADTPTDPPDDPPPPDEPTNVAPTVSAGNDQTVFVSDTVQLQADVQDDGLPGNSVTSLWTKANGPGTATFDDATAVDTSVTFDIPGTYVLRLSASDGQLQDSDDVTVQVQTDPDPIDALVGNWLLNEAGGQTALDSSGQENHGAIFGDPSWIAGVSGSALQLDGRDDRVLIADDPSLDTENSLTISAWLKPEQQSTQYVVTKAAKKNVDGFELSLSSQGSVFIRFNQDSSGNDFRLDSASDYPTDGNTWIHVAATYDGQTIRMYVNGQLETSREATFAIGTNDLDVSLGAQHDGYRPFTGGLDEVRLFSRALSAADISTLYQG